MPRGQRARRGAPSRPAPKSTRPPQNRFQQQTRPDFPRGRNPQPPQQHAHSSRETLYISSDDSIDLDEDEDEDDMDITVHYRLNGEGPSADSRKRGRGYGQADERDHASRSKRARTGRADADGLGASWRGSYGDSDSAEDGEIEDEWEGDARVDEAPSLPAKRRSAVRFEAESPVDDTPPLGLQFKPDPAPGAELANDLVIVPPQFSRITFKADEVIRFDFNHEDGGEVDEDEDEDEEVEEDIQQFPLERYLGTDSGTIDPERWIFNFGKHKRRPFAEILEEDPSYIKFLAGHRKWLKRRNGELRAVIEYHCPEVLQQVEQSGPATSRPSRLALAINGGIHARHPRDYVFDFGQHNGSRFDQVPESYLSELQGQVLSGGLDDRAGLEEAFEWHRWGGRGSEEPENAIGGSTRNIAKGRGGGRGNVARGGTNPRGNRGRGGGGAARGRGGGAANGASRGRGGGSANSASRGRRSSSANSANRSRGGGSTTSASRGRGGGGANGASRGRGTSRDRGRPPARARARGRGRGRG